MEVDIKKLKDKVRDLLMTDINTRSSDMYLMKVIWKEECGNMDVNTLDEFFSKFVNGDFSHFESVRRCRAKWQEEYPELRGDNYKERKAKESIIVGDLTTLFR